LNKNVKTRKIANVLKTAGNIAKYLKFQPKAPLLGALQGMIIGFEVCRKKTTFVKN